MFALRKEECQVMPKASELILTSIHVGLLGSYGREVRTSICALGILKLPALSIHRNEVNQAIIIYMLMNII